MTAAEFEAATGQAPAQDDLARANCNKPLALGHMSCGVCDHRHASIARLCGLHRQTGG